MKRIVVLIILLFSFSMHSLADNARVDARRAAERDVNDTVWALAGFSAPITYWGLVYDVVVRQAVQSHIVYLFRVW